MQQSQGSYLPTNMKATIISDYANNVFLGSVKDFKMLQSFKGQVLNIDLNVWI